MGMVEGGAWYQMITFWGVFGFEMVCFGFLLGAFVLLWLGFGLHEGVGFGCVGWGWEGGGMGWMDGKSYCTCCTYHPIQGGRVGLACC